MWPFSKPKSEVHICDEFTQWEAMRCTVRIVKVDDNGCPLPGTEVLMSQFWQERRCTICGFIYQRPLDFNSFAAEGEMDEEDDDDDDAPVFHDPE